MKNNSVLNSNINCVVEDKILMLDGYEIHYYISGKENDELIIFLHPAFSDHTAFSFQIDYFSKKYRVITIDLIGHGLSKAKKSKDKIDISSSHINSILEKEGYNKAHFVGVSMGTLIAQHFALYHPEKVLSLTSLGGYNINKKNKEVASAQRFSNLSLVLRAILSMDSFRKKAAEIGCYTEKGRNLFYKSAKQYERKSFMVMSGLENIVKDRPNIEPKYPLLILTGEHDIDLATNMSKDWHSQIKNSKYYSIANAGHCANLDNTEKFNEILWEFLESNK